MSLPAERLYTLEEYYDLADRALERQEYFQGRIYAMAGASPEHGRIGANLTAALSARLRGGGCRVYTADVRVHIQETGMLTYPDLSVVCGEPRFDDGRPKGILNPTVLIEVLSETTEGYDRGDKFRHYQTIPSLREYVLVSQARPRVEVFRRDSDSGGWAYQDYSGDDALLVLTSVEAKIPLAEIYEDVPFPGQAGHSG
jgi:Uma2 family endonuclease